MMLTRLAGRRTPIFLVRRFSDKAGDGDGKVTPPELKQDESVSKVSRGAASTQKIQDLLKTMIEANKSREENNRPQFATAPGTFKRRKPKPNVVEVNDKKIEESVTAAAADVAATLGGDVKKTEAELLSRVLGKVTPTPTDLSELVLGMKIDRSREPEEGFSVESRGQQVRRLVDRTRPQGARPPQASRPPFRRDQRRVMEREPKSMTQAQVIDIFSASPLGILKPTSSPNYGTRLETWEKLKQRELTLATAQPPANYFQKMIQWTEQGKVWKFPLDNEQGLDEEAQVHFSEHVFLDSHLEGWCPRRGPVRHFMELVCVGLSKNPFYTAQEKKDHIMWYKEYFESKKDILVEVGALDSTEKSEINV